MASDVCKVLTIANARDALSRLDLDEKGVVTTDTLGGPQETAIINESGLYSLILTSRKPEANVKYTPYQIRAIDQRSVIQYIRGMSRKQAARPEPIEEGEPPRKVLFRLVELKTPPVPEQVRIDSGTLLSLVQDGVMLGMPISRPMPSIGAHVHELRLSDPSGEWRIIYRIEDDVILLVDRFKKTSRKTEQADIRRSQQRLADHDARVAAAMKASQAKTKKKTK